MHKACAAIEVPNNSHPQPFLSMRADQSNQSNERRNGQCSEHGNDEVPCDQVSGIFEAIMHVDAHDTISRSPEKEKPGQDCIEAVALALSSSPPLPKSGSNLTSNPPSSGRITLWQRLKWGLILSLGGNRSLSYVSGVELKVAIAATLEAALMGSALVLTVSLQIQEVVGGRGGFSPGNGDPVARYIFVVASALSFALCFYSIMTSFILLLELSSCPSK